MSNIIFPQLQYMKPSEVTEEEKKSIAKDIRKYCPTLFENDGGDEKNPATSKENKSMIYVVSFAKLYDIPLLTYFVDCYHRILIDNWIDSKSHLHPKDFIKNYKFMQELKQMSTNTDIQEYDLYTIFEHIIPTFHKRFFQFPKMASSLYKYDDDLSDYIEITQEINNALRGISETNRIETTDIKQPFPSHLDVWIIPKDVIKDQNIENDDYDIDASDDSDSYNDSDDDNDEKKHIDRIGNIEKRLRVNKQRGFIQNYEKYETQRVSTNWKQIFRKILRENKDIQCLRLQPYTRHILLIDRRKKHADKIYTYFYTAQNKYNIIPKEQHPYLRCANFYNSSQILPLDTNQRYEHENDNISLFSSVDGFMFGLSYHINSANSIAVYWSSHGSGFRMFETDMKNIWPHYFKYIKIENNNNNNEPDSIRDSKYKDFIAQKVNRQSFVEFKDESFERFYLQTTGKNDLYKRNEKFNVVKNNIDKIIQIINGLMAEWSKEVQLTVTYIEEQYEEDVDVEDIIGDIESGVGDSEILWNLIEHDIEENRVTKFGNKLIEVLQ